MRKNESKTRSRDKGRNLKGYQEGSNTPSNVTATKSKAPVKPDLSTDKRDLNKAARAFAKAKAKKPPPVL